MHITCVSVPVSTRAPTGATNAYLVSDESRQSDGLLVDPATRTPELDSLVESGVTHIAVTHTHPDHVGAVADYAHETGATVWCRRGYERLFAEATGVSPDRTFVEGTTIPVGAGVEVLDTPGHARDHVGFVVGDDCLCGDLAVAEGSVVVGAPEGDVRAYLVALRRLHARNPGRLLPGHGPEVEDSRTTLARLVAHRNSREEKVLDAIRAGNETPNAVTDAAYDKDITSVRDLARATVVAHIEKLAAERRVRWDPVEGRVTPA
ncbi:MBL fold metallo-hydrolase [Haloferax mediterranei ATCC 33500]|uniref:MBL fold metallo-hydrolase n=1 Tax=Haloferax mediterranei (strain ATCC 33500 / DSM 1411 / JCM 8866 / NBRC 14739 / NCIMB 2177 / R-4) TaxID=523841 RepID=I3R2J3_HALMT|nr:MBL fold metallo-hydrolase [Haloferax mediterranei]AFK18453.1 Zn-dependent hydrolase, glyoxylase [Haloferax mediterranei ATCC 33500]AHZ22160.1 metallo-beta-lactamase [Haloferax mediterranei ATCC 33500]EMA02272.1 Zn-dependent hydrolase [Haloferax mediterranei ATCC 33500]MDX5988545.1 MBL fold metallo-hydrolase [Haloferax mediterranei ATCC 33500]QCQ74959.1 MBL fold metallo-hydrolase [Haloferax mediterranei ATCC 33500]